MEVRTVCGSGRALFLKVTRKQDARPLPQAVLTRCRSRLGIRPELCATAGRTLTYIEAQFLKIP